MKRAIAILICFLLSAQPVLAVGNLDELQDTINTMTLGVTSQHLINFILPAAAEPILTTDYIQIYFPSYSDVTIPTGLSGPYSGTPSYTVSGNYVRITGIGLAPGSYLRIEGITTTNPNSSNAFRIYVNVTEDEGGVIIKNTASTIPSTSNNTVTITTTIPTPQSRIQISGYTSPNTFVTFTEEGSVMGTHIASQLGYFSKIFSGLEPGDFEITLFGVDNNNLTTSPYALSLYAPAYQQTTVADILLSPTINIDSTEILQGDDLIASGSAKPGAQITLFTDVPLRSYTASASATGAWDYTIDNTSDYVIGDYRIYSIAQDAQARQSLTSVSLNFSIISSSGSTGSACGDISNGDLNCDDTINLTDFSILMYYWGTTNATADMNSDTVVNLTDFSIMMYYWGT